jgi:glycosyltransferase involved in cell wall biosynthesis
VKILIDASNLKVGGAIQVCVSLIEQLITDKYKNFSFYYIVSDAVYKQAKCFLKAGSYEIITTDIKTVLPFNAKKLRIKKIAKQSDFVFTVFGPTFWGNVGDKHLIGFANPWIVTPDTIAYHKLSRLNQYSVKFKVLILKHLLWNKHSHYVTETAAIKKRFMDLYNCGPERISVVPNCLNYVFHNLIVKDLSDKFNLSKIDCFKFVTITHNYPHKNLSVIPYVYKILQQMGVNCKFVVTIDATEYQNLNDDFKESTHNLGPVSIADCPSIYKNCDALFLPTLIECFTASYLEAMKMHIPICTSDLDFARTICQDAAYYFDPVDCNNIALTLSDVVRNKKRNETMADRGDKILSQFPDHIERVEKFMKLINGDYNV